MQKQWFQRSRAPGSRLGATLVVRLRKVGLLGEVVSSFLFQLPSHTFFNTQLSLKNRHHLSLKMSPSIVIRISIILTYVA